MTDWNRATMASRVLEHLGIKAPSQGANPEDNRDALEAVDSAHEKLRKEALAPFATSAFPPWAQFAFRDYVAGTLAGGFGYTGARLGEFKKMAQDGRQTLETQTAGYRHPVAIAPDPY